MKTVYDEAKNGFHLGEQLARGGQGTVWQLAGCSGFLAKVYHAPLTVRDTAKHRVLRGKASTLKDVAALPISLAYGDAMLAKHVGVFLPHVGGNEVFELYGTRSRIQNFPKANFKFLVRVAYNLAVAFEELHSQGIVVGDVNEQNIKVLPDATVRFIDADSFQIRNGADLYTTDVGTPLWTAPELHGNNLTGLPRTPNHDLFGLAQLIFLVLFAGRHPFAGVPRTTHHLQPEEAIRLHAFAFAPQNMNLPLGPPPGSPRLEMLPVDIRDAFFKAFLKSGVNANARPTARHWRQLLEALSRELVVCAHCSSHVYWSKAPSCPWCLIVRETGVDIFPPAPCVIGVATTQTTNSDAYLLRLAALRPYPFTVTRPASFTNIQPSPLPEAPTGFWSSLNKVLSAQNWKQRWLNPSIQKCKATIQQTEGQILVAQTEQQRIISEYNKEVGAHTSSLAEILRSLRGASTIRAQCMQAVKEERKQVELKAYLERFRIRAHKINQIGPSRLTTITSFGIETAADISSASLSRTGIPANAVYELLQWKRNKESQFRCDATRPLSEAESREAERRVQDKLRKLREDAAGIEVKINKATSRTQVQLRTCEATIQQQARQREQATADLVKLETELNKPD